MADVNFNDLFGNFTAADALAVTETKKSGGFSNNPNIYHPTIKDEKCKDMNYRALVRFMPFFHEGKWRTTLTRWECFLKDVNGNNGVFVISPKTDGKKCPMRSLSYQLYKSENAIDRENSKLIQVYQQYYALIEVISDVQHPELNGKFFIYQFGQKIYDKIIAAQTSTDFSDGFNPFALYNARCFEINMTKGEQKMNGNVVASYEQCRFSDRTAPIHYGDGVTLDADDVETQKGYLAWLEKDAPQMKDYLWKEWDSETTEKVNANLATYRSGYSAPRSTVAAATEAINIVSETKVVKESPVSTPKIEDELPDFSAAEASAGETPVSADDEAWINDILNA